MNLKMSVKTVAAALGISFCVAGTAVPASAQGFGYPEYRRWDEPQRYRPIPQAQDPYEDRDDQADEPSNDSDNNRYGDWRDRQERYNAERRYRYRDEERPRRYVEPDDQDDNDFNSGRYRRDTAREPEFDDQQAQGPGASGGPRSYIQPAAPPRVAFGGGYAIGSIAIDTSARKLYYVTGPMSAYAYPIGVGREGFSWTGSEKISRVADWPDWYPPAEMRKRKPQLPEKMLGGINNPLGAKAMYLGNTLYRIHGTNDPKSIGKAESSGCFRMLNSHVLHLASLAGVGTQVTVVKSLGAARVATKPVAKPRPVVERVRYPRYPRWSDDYYSDGYR